MYMLFTIYLQGCILYRGLKSRGKRFQGIPPPIDNTVLYYLSPYPVDANFVPARIYTASVSFLKL